MAPVLFIVTALSGLGRPSFANSAEPPSWGEFSRFQARRSPVTIILGTVSVSPDARRVYWAKRVGGSTEGGTTDSVKCPSLVAVIESIRTIPLPKAQPGKPEAMIGDGTMYSLTVPSTYSPPFTTNLDKLTITSAGGPLGAWVDGAMVKLESCWLLK
jgi:hypothetical protein